VLAAVARDGRATCGVQVMSMLTNTIDRLFQRNPRYDGHRLLGTFPITTHSL